MHWPSAPPYIQLSELCIPGSRASYKVLKQAEIIEDGDRVWKEGEAPMVDLTLVRCCKQHFVLHLYVCAGTDNDYTAYRLQGCFVNVPAVARKVPAREGLRVLYEHLLKTGDEAVRHLVALLKEDLTARQTLRRNLLQFSWGKKNEALGDVRAVVKLDEDNRFVLRLEKAYWVLVDDPTHEQAQAIKDVILQLPVGDV